MKKFPYFVILFSALSLTSSCFLRIPPNWKAETEHAEQVIIRDSEVRRLNILCEQLPKPNDFEFLGKRALKGSGLVSNYYKTSLDYKQVRRFYGDYFQRNGWKLSEEMANWGAWFEFTKDGDYVSIQRLSTKEFSSISCSNEK